MQTTDRYRLAIITAQKVQRWALFGLVLLGLMVAKWVHLPIGKGLVWGAVVAFLMQYAFTKLTFLRLRPHPKQMMNDMYLAMLARWAVAILGFVFGFLWLKLNGLGVIVGFLLMQACILVSLHRMR